MKIVCAQCFCEVTVKYDLGETLLMQCLQGCTKVAAAKEKPSVEASRITNASIEALKKHRCPHCLHENGTPHHPQCVLVIDKTIAELTVKDMVQGYKEATERIEKGKLNPKTRELIKKRLADVDAGRVISTKELKRRLKKNYGPGKCRYCKKKANSQYHHERTCRKNPGNDDSPKRGSLGRVTSEDETLSEDL